jgi:uncharacterized protein (DUF2384 family)
LNFKKNEMNPDKVDYDKVLKSVPGRISESEILYMIQNKEINWEHLDTIKELTNLTDETISAWLNISVRSFRSYRQGSFRIKESLKEQVIYLLSLIKHGIDVFGSKEGFDQWLTSKNFLLDGRAPVSFLSTVTGIRFIDDRLTAIEFGDNV